VKFVAIDTETTGLDPTINGILSIAAYHFEIAPSGAMTKPKRLFAESCNPGDVEWNDWSLGQHAINQMTPTTLEGQMGPRALGYEFYKALKQYDTNPITEPWLPIYQNAAFDISFLRLCVPPESMHRLSRRYLDTYTMQYLCFGEIVSLDALCEKLGVPLSGYHTAAGDALATALCFQTMWRLMRPEPMQASIARHGVAGTLEASRTGNGLPTD